jgi:hypothetical protein
MRRSCPVRDRDLECYVVDFFDAEGHVVFSPIVARVWLKREGFCQVRLLKSSMVRYHETVWRVPECHDYRCAPLWDGRRLGFGHGHPTNSSTEAAYQKGPGRLVAATLTNRFSGSLRAPPFKSSPDD